MPTVEKRKIPVSKSNWFVIFEMITTKSNHDPVIGKE